MMRISVVIVGWNGLRHLPACFDALMPQLPADSEVILVDNGSSDGTSDWVCATWPAVRLIRLPENLGFAGGVNAGLRVARGARLMLLNDDAFVEPGCISALLEALEQAPQIGAAAVVLTFAHQPGIVASAGVCLRRDGVAMDLWAGRSVVELPDEPVPIAGPSGGAVIYQRALLEDIGLMEPGFFSYLEDVDLVWRALLRGWHSVVVPHARARHVYSATSGQGSPFKQHLLGRNRLRVIVRCMPGSLLLRCLPAIIAYDLLAALYAVATRQPAMLAGRLEALRELPVLVRERRQIQAYRSAPVDQIARWLEPAVLPWHALRDQKRLDAILKARP